MELSPKKFTGEPIQVQFDEPPPLEKTPEPPGAFSRREQSFRVTQVLREWVRFRHLGRKAPNMQPQHATKASRCCSWGVGVIHFRVRTDIGQVFDLYYDRSPRNADHHKGEWFLFQELDSEPLS
jgi:hypothetical protein